jgi:hypothetical protein
MALTNAVRWAGAGLEAVHVSYIGSTGFFAGAGNLTAASTNLASGMRRIQAAQEFPLAIPETVRQPVNGDDSLWTTFLFASQDPASGIFNIGAQDGTFHTMTTGSTKYTPQTGEWDLYAAGGTLASPGTLCFLVTRQAKDQSSAGFETELWFATTADSIGPDNRQFQATAPYRYVLAASPVTTLPWGVSSSTAFGKSTSSVAFFAHTYRFYMSVYVGNNVATETPALDYTPVSTALTKAFLFSNGSTVAVASVNTSTKTVTFSSAPASGAIVVIFYAVSSF